METWKMQGSAGYQGQKVNTEDKVLVLRELTGYIGGRDNHQVNK